MPLKSNFFSLLICISILLSCQPKDQKPFEEIPDTYPVLKKVLQNPDVYQVQMLYTQINRDENNEPSFKDFEFRLDDDKYFYPASTVKLPVAILALEWLGEQNLKGLTAHSTMLSDSVRTSQLPAYYDSTAINLMPSIAHYIRKILLVSDNDAFNRLYELLGQDYINAKMQDKGMTHTVINHRLSMPMSEEENRYYNPIRFLDEEGEVIHEIPERNTKNIYSNPDNPKIGNAYYSKGELIGEPMDFTFKNKFAISDFHGVVKRIVFPETFAPNERFNISEEDRKFILQYMSMLPGESDYPKYDLPEYYNSYSKFYKFGTDKNPIPSQFRIFNKTGNAYGHLIDGSYFVDFDNGVEFLVTAVIYTNANETLNDDTYEYEELAFPFFAELGEYLYQLELKREKERRPVLSELKMDY
ncbi:serine hydrolase [Aquiflexum sp.]|uniref:serine hydrolase n=1 Tax=Aquiflexum sp. TaxID=1872584 RepID=UPI003593BECA